MDTISIGVFRIFGDELDQLVNDNDATLQLHHNKKQSLHDLFDNQKEIAVLDSG